MGWAGPRRTGRHDMTTREERKGKQWIEESFLRFDISHQKKKGRRSTHQCARTWPSRPRWPRGRAPSAWGCGRPPQGGRCSCSRTPRPSPRGASPSWRGSGAGSARCAPPRGPAARGRCDGAIRGVGVVGGTGMEMGQTCAHACMQCVFAWVRTRPRRCRRRRSRGAPPSAPRRRQTAPRAGPSADL